MQPRLALSAAIVLGIAGGLSMPATAQNAKCPSATGKDFRGQDLTDHNFRTDPPGSLRSANFAGAKLSGAAFDQQDLTGASFEGANLGPSKKGSVGFTKTILDHTCFMGANLDKTDFTHADIKCADFSQTSLMYAKFGPTQEIHASASCRTKFVGATLDVRLIGNDFSGKSNWSKSDFTDANFQNSGPPFSLAGKDVTGAILAGTIWIGIDMTGANLTDVDFSRANITQANLSGTAANGAKFYNTKASEAKFVCAQFYGTGGGQQKKPDGSTCPKPPATTNPMQAADFRLATLFNADFTSAILDHARLSGANLNRASLPNASLAQATLQSTQNPAIDVANVQFADFTSVNFTSANLTSVDFSGGLLTSAVFDGKGTKLAGAKFANATLPNASFREGVLQAVSFSGAILQLAHFDGAEMSVLPDQFAVNFQCAQLGGASFKDAKISAGNFSAAVMPVAPDCCEGKSGPYCGNIDATQGTYGAVTLPLLDSPVVCPNGDVAKCQSAQWQLSPNWQTTRCSRDGVMRTMWAKPNCSGQPGDYVKFTDPNLKACILKRLPGQTEVAKATAAHIQQVVCPSLGIAGIGGLEWFTGMDKLDLSGNRLTQFTLRFDQASQSQLVNLDVSNNELTTLDLRGHPKLLILNAANNRLSSVSLHANTSLLVLNVSRNEIESFDLAIQDQLTYADLSHNKLGSVLDDHNNDLNRLTSLGYLNLSHNAIPTIGSAAPLAWNRETQSGGKLQSLSLACNAQFDCETLKLYDGSKYPAAATAKCSRYDAGEKKWNPIRTPDCPPGK